MADMITLGSFTFFVLLGIHLLLSGGIAWIGSNHIDGRFHYSQKKIFYFFFLFNFSLPVLGYLSSLWILYYLLHVRYVEELKEINFLDLELFENEFINIRREFGESSIQNIIANKTISTEKKIKALVSLADNISQNNIEIIKDTLSSSNDEVRLFGFAIIDKIERGINGKIYKLLDSFNSDITEQKKASIARDLTYLYWEILYFQLSDDSINTFILTQVKHYIAIAKEVYADDIKLRILSGRVLMMEKQYDEAESEFHKANELSGENIPFVMPYLAEIAFIRGDYHTVSVMMQETPDLDLNSKLYPIVQQWSA